MIDISKRGWKMKRQFVWILALMLCFSVQIALADGTVAKIGNTQYTTIDSAINAWIQNGGTLTLLADAKYSQEISLTAGKVRTFDGGDHVLSLNDIGNDGELTINSGTIDFHSSLNNDGSLTINGGTLDTEHFYCFENEGTLTINGGSILIGIDPKSGNDETYAVYNIGTLMIGGRFGTNAEYAFVDADSKHIEITSPAAVPDDGYTFRVCPERMFSQRVTLRDTLIVVDENGNAIDMNSSIPYDEYYFSRIFTIKRTGVAGVKESSGKITSYSDINDAIAAWIDNPDSTLMLYEDAVYSEDVLAMRANGHTLDGVGHTMTLSGGLSMKGRDSAAIHDLTLIATGGIESSTTLDMTLVELTVKNKGVVNSGTMNIIDSTVSGTEIGVNNSGTLNLTNARVSGIKTGINSTGTLNISSGTISADVTGVENSGTATISGGTITAKDTGIRSTNALTVKNGKISSSGVSGYGVYSTGTVSISGGTITASGEEGYGIFSTDGKNVTITGGTISAEGKNGCGVHSGASGTVAITGGTISAEGQNGCGIHSGTSGTVTISGGTIRAAGTAMYNDGGTLNLQNGTISTDGAGNHGVYNSNFGTANITGGTIAAAGDNSYGLYNSAMAIVSAGTFSASGTGSSGAANVGGVMRISGGTVSAEGHALYNAVGATTIDGGKLSSPGTGVHNASGSVTIKNAEISGDQYDLANAATMSIDESVSVPADGLSYYALGSGSVGTDLTLPDILKARDSDKNIVTELTAGNEYLLEVSAAAAVSGEGIRATYYPDFASALAAWTGETTLTLMEDATHSGNIASSPYDRTINGNGHTLTLTGGFIDNSDGKTLTIENTTIHSTGRAINNTDGSVVVIAGSTLTNTSAYSPALSNSGTATVTQSTIAGANLGAGNTGTMILDDCQILDAVKYGVFNSAPGNLTITGSKSTNTADTSIAYHGGKVTLEAVEEGWMLYTSVDGAVIGEDIVLPEGFCVRSSAGEAPETLSVGTYFVVRQLQQSHTHAGGMATCLSLAKCSVCGRGYGRLNPENHESGESVFTDNGTTHTKVYACCGAAVQEEHVYVLSEDGKWLCICGKQDDSAIAELPKTGDDSRIMLWLAALGAAALAMTALRKKSYR